MGVCTWGECGSVVCVPEVERWVFLHGVNTSQWWVLFRRSGGCLYMVGVPEVEQWVFLHEMNTGQWWVLLRQTVIRVMGVSAFGG